MSPSQGPDGSLSARLAGRDNALNFVRLLLAVSVMVSHLWPTAGLHGQWVFDGDGIGGWAVDGFFVLSGYLIMGSRMRLSLRAYFARRALRILPGFWVCLIVVAFVFAPLAAWREGVAWSPTSATTYVGRNLALWIDQWGVDHTLTHTPYQVTWDSPLWTLAYEFLAYIGAGLVLSVALARRRPVWTTGALLVLASLSVPAAFGPLHITTSFWIHLLRLGTFFVAGMFLRSIAHRVPANAVLGIGSLAAVFVIGSLGFASHWTALPLAYFLLWVGAVLPVRIGARNDVSYGMYVYGFPVQQLGAVLGLATWPPVLNLVTCVAVTVPIAWASWRVVERPALRLVRTRPTPSEPAGLRRQPVPAGGSPTRPS
ncbi:acyltransferase [Allobranchiibius sp. CTAmp26]|uniref:acyltransferase family protein n=1 Tax=Allobranchiibius sp. CTAmp26 TaxID=2815214 RepID=UPI001AA0D497|nr:acyltransferase [Allobranchiibius sp. CTAmp26]MBO1756228.1 acyltransferase [Allobranchiibius sp. CTAmp26]